MIRAARAGRRWFSPSISVHPGGQRSVSADGLRGTPTLPRVRLTSREAELLQLIAEGKASKQVATALGLSIKTVEKHRQSLMKKLDIHDVAGLTRYAILIGSIEGRDRSATS
jgi:DNA-binding NarL/FixJ family response regulator